MAHREQAGVKRHARRADRWEDAPVWAGDDRAWQELRREPRPQLWCPEPDCTVELVSYQNDHNSVYPRFFKYKAGSRGCEHWTAHADGGGQVSARHRWLQDRLETMARDLGYDVTREHPQTHADVFVHEPSYCLEVQLRPTSFQARTRARQAWGAQVCWLIAPEVNSPKAKDALFNHGGVRVRVVDRLDRTRVLAPWDTPQNRDLDRRARLQVYGTVAHRPSPEGPRATKAGTWFTTGPMDGDDFLRQILSDQRIWLPKRSAGNRFGVWALREDLATYRNWERASRTHRTPVKVQGEPPPATPPAIEVGERVGTPRPEDEPTAPPPATATPAPRAVTEPATPPVPDRPVSAATPTTGPATRRWWHRWWPRSR
jgi:hypothetical protein